MSIALKNVSFAYDTRPVLKDISFSADYGQFVSVLGPNGVGKSTLFRCMLGLLKPNAGEITIGGKSIDGMSAAELSREIAYIPQSHNPVFNFSVFDMVLMGTTSQVGSFSSPGRKQQEIADNAIEKLGIGYLRDRGYSNISGGERQLALIARAIAQQARILIMDEPSASLDYGNRIKVMRTIRQLSEEGYCIIQSTHDPDQAYLYSDKILAIYEGAVLSFGNPEDIINNELISTLYGVDVEVKSIRDDSIRVCVPRYIREKEKGVR